MIIENLSLVFFTILIQCAVGMSIAGACFGSRSNLSEKAELSLASFWRITAIIATLALIASVFHLAKPLAAITALTNIGVAWLSNEILSVGAFFALTVIMAFGVHKCGYGKMRIVAFITAIIGLISLLVQGLTYAPEAMPAIANSFPFMLFLLTSLILGAGLYILVFDDTCDCSIYSTCIWIMIVLLLVVPCVWTSGSEIMFATAKAWGSSCFYWAALGLLLLALVLKAYSQIMLSFISVFVALFVSRIVFFDCTLHTNTLLGLPY